MAPERIEVLKQHVRTTACKEDFYVSCGQPAANLISSLLEPQSEYGLIRYRACQLTPARGSTFCIARILKGPKPSVTAP